MRTFTDLLNGYMGGFNPRVLRKGIRITLPAENAARIFSKDVVRELIGGLDIGIRWKPEEAEITVRAIP
ncbi:MAG: hypothetical protein AB1480_10680 [Nitrospirota bacterium]